MEVYLSARQPMQDLLDQKGLVDDGNVLHTCTCHCELLYYLLIDVYLVFIISLALKNLLRVGNSLQNTLLMDSVYKSTMRTSFCRVNLLIIVRKHHMRQTPSLTAKLNPSQAPQKAS